MDLTRVSPCVSPEDVHRESSTAVGAIHKAMVSLRVELAKKNELITELREKIESKSSSATPHFEDVFVLQVGEDQDGGRGQVHKDQYDEILLYEESLAEKEASTADEARPRHDPVIAFVASDDDDDQLEKKHGLNIPLRLKKDFLLHPPPTSSSLRSAHSNSLSALSVSSRPILRPPSIEAKRSVASQTDVSALGTRLWSSEPLLDQIRHGFFLPELKIRRKLTSKHKQSSDFWNVVNADDLNVLLNLTNEYVRCAKTKLVNSSDWDVILENSERVLNNVRVGENESPRIPNKHSDVQVGAVVHFIDDLHEVQKGTVKSVNGSEVNISVEQSDHEEVRTSFHKIVLCGL